MRARRKTDPAATWQPALPAIDPATGELAEQFAGLGLEDVAADTRIVVEALNSWSAETGKQHAEVTLLGDTYHAGEQLLNPKVDPFVLLDQVDQAVSPWRRPDRARARARRRRGCAGPQGRAAQRRRAAFGARQQQVIDHVRARGVVIEANMSSNTEISNPTDGEHPAGRFAQEGLRVTVNTDDETVLDTDMRRELDKVSHAQASDGSSSRR